MLAFPLAQVPASAEERERERDQLQQEGAELDVPSFLQSVVEDVDFDYALCGRVQGSVPGLNEEESEDDRENPFSFTDPAELPITQALDDAEAAVPYQGEDSQTVEPAIRVRYNRIPVRAQHVAGDGSVLAKLVEHGLLAKLTQLVLFKARVPSHLRDEAAQEVQATWSLLKAHPDYMRNQMARYAYLSGEHAALKIMRALGAVVALPSSMFSKTAKDVKGANAKFLQYIGAATNPHDIEDYSDSLEVSDALVDSWEREVVSLSFFKTQMGQIAVTPKQYQIAEMFLVDRDTVDDIAEKLKLTVKYVERSMHKVADALNDRVDKHSVKREELGGKRKNALRKKGIMGAAQGAEAVAISGKVQEDAQDMGFIEDAAASRRTRSVGSDDDIDRVRNEDEDTSAPRRRKSPSMEGDTDWDTQESQGDEPLKQRTAGAQSSGWDIAEMPDMYSVDYVQEKLLSSAAVRRLSLGNSDGALELAVGACAETTQESVSWTIDDLMEFSEQEHKRFSAKDVAVEVESVMVDHLEFEF